MQNPWSHSYTLIPLDKRADHRPIGVGEVLRRIAGKAVMILLRKNVLQAARLLRLCRGQVAGSEYLWFMQCMVSSMMITWKVDGLRYYRVYLRDQV